MSNSSVLHSDGGVGVGVVGDGGGDGIGAGAAHSSSLSSLLSLLLNTAIFANSHVSFGFGFGSKKLICFSSCSALVSVLL